MADNNLRNKVESFQNGKLKFKNQKTPIITLLITALTTKNNTYLFSVPKLDNMISY